MAEFDAAPLAIETVALVVRDLDRVAEFYGDAVGLAELRGDGETRVLGAGGRPLLELHRDAHARERGSREAGLFHTAFLLPTRQDLGRWLRHAAERRLPLQGASDHVVSEAVYLADPEGNGIEIYADKPRASWTWKDGTVAMRTDPLDREALIRAAGADPWRGTPDGATVGHVHLQVGALDAADAFYAGVLGLDITARYPGASFFSSGGYHHHIGANIWNSRGAPARSEPATGLLSVAIHLREPDLLDALDARAAEADLAATRNDRSLELRDPWGTRLRFSAGV